MLRAVAAADREEKEEIRLLHQIVRLRFLHKVRLVEFIFLLTIIITIIIIIIVQVEIEINIITIIIIVVVAKNHLHYLLVPVMFPFYCLLFHLEQQQIIITNM